MCQRGGLISECLGSDQALTENVRISVGTVHVQSQISIRFKSAQTEAGTKTTTLVV